MIDLLLNIGCAFDWITPSIAFIQDFISGPVSDFGIPVNPYWGRGEIKRLLKRNGIHVWGLMYNFEGDVLLFTVNKRHAEMTYYLLRKMGIPLVYAPAEVVESFYPEPTWFNEASEL